MKIRNFLIVSLFFSFFAMGLMTAFVHAEDVITVNINTASSEELSNLDGIGLIKADAIVSYREKNGNFSAIEDLKNVSGIGDVIFDGLKDNITVGDGDAGSGEESGEAVESKESTESTESTESAK
ncbi:MAG: ComEA family DNA-binding protein [Candidatus Anammoxibacter sp.]